MLYTAIFGRIGDSLRSLPFPTNRAGLPTAVAFLDKAAMACVVRENKHKGWRLAAPAFQHANPRRAARQHKLLEHELFPDAQATIWVDGCLSPLHSPLDLVATYLAPGYDLATFRHSERQCVYQEAEACLQLKKDNPALINGQVARYTEEGFPREMGLGETTCVIRRRTNRIIEFNSRWWAELKNGSLRDQLSFDYCCWQTGVRYRHLAGNRMHSPHFLWRYHRRVS